MKLSKALEEVLAGVEFDSVQKSYENILYANNAINKAGVKDFGSLVTIKRQVIRNGKPYETTLHVRPEDYKKTKDSSGSHNNFKQTPKLIHTKKASHSSIGNKVSYVNPITNKKEDGKIQKIYKTGVGDIAVIVKPNGYSFTIKTENLKKENE